MLSQDSRSVPTLVHSFALIGEQRDFPLLCFHTQFEQHAAQTPDAQALLFEDEQHQHISLSYHTLNSRANALAEILRERKQLQPGEIVGICLPSTPELVVSFLAINKAGGAALFLDAEAPIERITFLLARANARLLLTHHSIDATALISYTQDHRMSSGSENDVLYLEDYASRERESNVDAGSTMDAISYAIATSGTEGTPKIVLIPHRGLANYIAASIMLRAVQPGDRVLQVLSPCFDAAVGQTVLALAAGATLCLGARSILSSGPAILTFLHKHAITHAAFTPSILSAIPAADLPHLRSIESGGERCSLALIRQWAVKRQFINVYGPTECTIAASYYECMPDMEGEVPIGTPLQNTWIAILNDQQQPVSSGETGEIVIGGIGVAQGYLHQPELTTQRFIVQDGISYYKTGDNGYIDAHGILWYRGRVNEDLEVKIGGGRRFDRGEIEKKLLEHTDILTCAVILWNGHLIAFLVPRDPHVRPDVTTLKAHLSTWLPEFAIPKFYIWRESLPLTPTGKVAREALPIPEWNTFAQHGEFRAPLTSTEQRLALLIAEVLDAQYPSTMVVNALTTFISMGLDSLSITDFLLGTQSAFDCDVSLDEGVLLSMSLEHFANYIDKQLLAK